MYRLSLCAYYKGLQKYLKDANRMLIVALCPCLEDAFDF
jgi:hypothetical protein